MIDEPGTPDGGRRTLRARWLLPIDRPPIRDGWLEIAGGRIVRLGDGQSPEPAMDLGHVAILPGLVNAHTHLELSWMAGRLPSASSMVEWIRSLMALRTGGPAGGETERDAAMRRAARAMRATGTVLVGDVSNTLTSTDAIQSAGLGGIVFHELVGFDARDPGAMVRDALARIDGARRRMSVPTPGQGPLQFSVSAHAPYSVSPALLAEIARRVADVPLTIHVGESPEEIEFLKEGSGAFRRLLEDLGLWTGRWQPPGIGPIAYLDRHRYIKPGLLAVHAVHLTREEIWRLRDAGAVVVSCPRSNVWVGGGLPRLARFYAEGADVAFGTDSLASAPSLNLFDELAEARRIAPDVTAACLLESATRVGAAALGCEATHGTLAPGKSAHLTRVALPAGVTDVEEYLVAGVDPGAIHPFD